MSLSEARVDETFDALANPTRRALLGLLLDEGDQPVHALAAHFDMRRPSVSGHLRVLREAGLVREERRGRRRYYQLRPASLIEVRSWLAPFEEFWLEKMASLQQVLDEESNS